MWSLTKKAGGEASDTRVYKG